MARKAWLWAVALVAISATLVESDQAPATPPHPKIVRLTPADAARIAEEERAKVTVEMPPGVELMLWAPEQLVVDPVAIDLDERGTVYVTSSTRNNMPLDIRQHPDWFTPAHTLKTRDDLLQFYRREMSPERSSQNTWIEDYNKDGSRDWRDLAEFKERVHRIQDTDGDGLADLSEILVEGFSDDPTWDIAGGILYDDGELIVGVPPGVYRLTGLNNGNGGTAGQRRIAISEGYNVHPAFGGHGISGVTLGPDGRIYWEVGDIGFSVVDKSGHRWSYPNQGAVLRANPDGSDFEVFATGIRNLQEFSFDEHGNLIFRGALLTGGNADRGRSVYTDNAASSCSRCHSLRGGADVGPNLSTIGATLTREQLLEALLEPNARISPGFGTVAIKLRSGQQIEGTLREDTDTAVVVTTGTPVVEQRISKADIAERTNPVSAMPPMGLLLKPREIRDLVQFLSTLK